MQPGSVVEYLAGKDLALGFCLEVESKGKLPIMTSSGRKESLASKKVLFSHQSPLPATASREERLAHLESMEQRKAVESQELDTQELWELLADEVGREWELAELAGFLFSEPGAWEKALVYRAVHSDKYRFSRKGDCFVLRTAEQVEEALQREATEAKREVERAAVKAWMQQVWENRQDEYPVEYQDLVEEWKMRIRNAALHGEDASHFQHVQRYLKELDGKALDAAFQFMVRLGEWTPDENLEILANQTPIAFPPQVLDEAALAAERLDQAIADPSRVDYTEWPCYSIDDPETTEIDDAMAWRSVEQGYELAIHIADASALVTPDLEQMENEIRYRATSIYLPDFKVRMVPELLSDDALSLREGVLRPALTFLVKLDQEGKLLEAAMHPSVIQVQGRLDYDTADQLVADGDPYWSTFARVAELLKEQREAKGAVNLPFPRMEVVVKGEQISLVPDERDSASQTMVSEMMILANRVAAEYLRDHGLPAIYRSQKAPEPPLEKRPEWKPHHLYEARRSFSRSSHGFEPSLHSGLGLDAYVQTTSPIRRYRDLILQRQIKHHLQTGEILYSKEELEEIITITSTPVSQAEKMERNRKGYYLHKLLLKQRGKEVDAVVLAANGERYTLQLKESLREVDVPQGGGALKAPGEQVRVKILSVYPRDRVLKVSSPL